MTSLTPMPTSSSRELAVGKFTASELAHFSVTLVKPKMIVTTPALTYVKKLILKSRSAIVTIPDGGGKSAILEAIDNIVWGGVALTKDDEVFFAGDEPEWICISDCPDADSLAKELWELEGCPSPSASEVWDKGRMGIFTRHRNGLTCFYCKRKCELVRLEIKVYFGTPGFVDDDVRIGLEKQGGDCPIIKNGMFSNLRHLKENIAIEVPKCPNHEYLGILQSLSRDRHLILLCPPEAENSLHELFPTFTMRKPSPLPINILPQIYAQRLKDAGLTVSPLPPSSLTLLAILSRGSPGQFLKYVWQLIDDMEMDGCEETASNAYVVRRIRDEISDSLAIQITVGQFKRASVSWVKAKVIRQVLLQQFNLDMDIERLGRLMTELGLRKRRNPDAEYHTGDFEVPNEVLECLTEGTEVTEGASQNMVETDITTENTGQ